MGSRRGCTACSTSNRRGGPLGSRPKTSLDLFWHSLGLPLRLDVENAVLYAEQNKSKGLWLIRFPVRCIHSSAFHEVSFQASCLTVKKKFALYRVSQKSVYVFSNWNISTIFNAINLIFLGIVDLSLVFVHIKFERNRPSQFWEIIIFFRQVKKQKRALEIQRATDSLCLIWLYSNFLCKNILVSSVCMHSLLKVSA